MNPFATRAALRLSLLMLLGALLLSARPGLAQEGDYEFDFLPVHNSDTVDVTGFPKAHLEFMLLKDGAHYAGEAEEGDFKVFEDGRPVPFQYREETLPVTVTIIYDALSYAKLAEDWEADKEIALNLAALTPATGTLQFCLTLGVPHCRPAALNRPGVALSLLYAGITQTRDDQPAGLDQVLNETLEPDGASGGAPLVILLRDEDPGLVTARRLPAEDVLRRINARNGAFTMIDLNRDGDPDDRIADFLRSMNARYYSKYVTNDCPVYLECVDEFIAQRLPLKRVITYDSALYRDEAAHEVVVRFDPEGNDTDPSSAATDFVFESVGGEAQLRPIVLNVSCAILGLAPLFLVLLMVLILRPVEETHGRSVAGGSE